MGLFARKASSAACTLAYSDPSYVEGSCEYRFIFNLSCSLDGLGAVVVFRFRWSVGGLDSSGSPSVYITSLDSFETVSEGLRESGLEDGVGWSARFM